MANCRIAILLAGFAAFAMVGCGSTASHPTVAPVSGQIKLNGQPLAGVEVNFFAEKAPRAATGKTDSEGKYQLTMFQANDGAIPGKNMVTVTMPTEAVSMDQMMSGKPTAAPAPKFPSVYSNPSSTPFSYEVQSGSNVNVDFDIK